MWRVRNIGIQYLPEVVQVTLGGDSGCGSTKIGFYLNNVEHPMSDDNFICLAVFHESEDYENILKVVEASLRDINLLSGFEINGSQILFEFFFVADLKFLTACFGLQGCSATYYCLWCTSKKDDTLAHGEISRSLNDLVTRGENAIVKKCLYGENSNKFKQFCKLQNYSVSRLPLFQFIALTHAVPPPLHIISGIINFTLKKAMLATKVL